MPPKCKTCDEHYWNGHPCKCGRTPDNQKPQQPVGLSETEERKAFKERTGKDIHSRAARLAYDLENKAQSVELPFDVEKLETIYNHIELREDLQETLFRAIKFIKANKRESVSLSEITKVAQAEYKKFGGGVISVTKAVLDAAGVKYNE